MMKKQKKYLLLCSTAGVLFIALFYEVWSWGAPTARSQEQPIVKYEQQHILVPETTAVQVPQKEMVQDMQNVVARQKPCVSAGADKNLERFTKSSKEFEKIETEVVQSAPQAVETENHVQTVQAQETDAQRIIKSLQQKGTPEGTYKVSETEPEVVVLDVEAVTIAPKSGTDTAKQLKNVQEARQKKK